MFTVYDQNPKPSFYGINAETAAEVQKCIESASRDSIVEVVLRLRSWQPCNTWSSFPFRKVVWDADEHLYNWIPLAGQVINDQTSGNNGACELLFALTAVKWTIRAQINF